MRHTMSEEIEQLTSLTATFKKLHQDNPKVNEYRSPQELTELINLDLGAQNDDEELQKLAQLFVDFSAKTGHKHYFNQLFSGFNSWAVIGDLLAVLMNTSMYTYEVAPLATLIERELVKKMNSYAGFNQGDGIFTGGGSNSNMMAMLCARHKKFPALKVEGLFGQKPISAFVSEVAHYSFLKASQAIGLGKKHLYTVESDANGKMIPAKLEQAIQESIAKGEAPFFIAATAGTTEVGAFDPILEMSEIAKKHNAWLHVDGSWGGSILLSPKHRHLFNGIEKADSMTWNPHKLMNVPLMASALLVKGANDLENALTVENTDYIFHEHSNDSYDLGKKSLHCGRRNDALKVWMAWKYFGDEALAANIEKLMDLGQKCNDYINNHPELEMLAPVASLNINFNFIAKTAKSQNDLNRAIREKLIENGKTMVNFCHLKDKLSIRLTLVNHELEWADMEEFFTMFVETGRLLDID